MNKIEIERICKLSLGENFKFRPGQLDIIKYMYDEYIKNPKGCIVFEGPCGSGKSLIAFCFSLIMNNENNNGYIIPSDLSLQKQYEDDLIKYRLL
jgi:Rad3-related DNA helicase